MKMRSAKDRILDLQSPRNLASIFCEVIFLAMQLGVLVGAIWFLSVRVAPRILRLLMQWG